MEHSSHEKDMPSILVVDDNPANSLVLTSMLEHMGLTADEAASGREAVNRVCEKEYDLILMDYLMPEMDGIEAIEQIFFVSEGKKRPVIVGASATVDKKVLDAFQKAGAAGVLEKPVRMKKLEELLEGLEIISAVPLEEETAEGENAGKDMESILSSVKGLDYQKGIQLMAGNVGSYIKVLLVSVKNISDNLQAITLIRGNTHMENVTLYFHSLKGIFLNIGADILAEQSRELEQKAREGQYDALNQALGDYLETAQSFVKDLEAACDACQKTNDTSSHTGEKLSSSDFDRKCEELRAHIEDFEYIEITELLEQMLSSVSGDQEEALRKIDEAIQNFEYDRALEILDTL